MSVGYRAASALEAGRLGLETALGLTPTGLVEQPRFFSGMVARPDVTAAAMLAVADVAGARYFDAGLAKRVANADPVVTASGDRLRFESFSLCNGVHARLDLLADGIEVGQIAHGTTNVDINQPLRTALAGVGPAELLHLDVGTDGLAVSTPEQTHTERPVDLPDRWVRGFAEVPVLTSRMTQRAELPGMVAARWLATLPRAAPGPSYHLVPSPGGLRQSLRPAPGSVHLAGAARLAATARVARFATRLRIYAGTDGVGDLASAWAFDLPGATLTLVLSPEIYRGFSGEGGLLTALAAASAGDAASRLLEHLAWEPLIDRAALASATGLSPADLEAGIAYLAASGKVGYDLLAQSWFHRELPWDTARAEGDNPRLRAARQLVASGALTATAEGWTVRSEDSRHFVTGDPIGCTCLWWAKYSGSRGPCKHVLATRLLEL
ncbi:SWIM zinc finger family protein [Ornithinimicrobium cerasi]|uniref:SWIM zinc finger n=1 Tax=Ornithinimicrobium cerasi TaxID=2248773 RepID=A0A285VI33_9MICO|nr:SWIM zinc finger family protein [Ornithinimicrobium cerasi]SOC53764.1 SWIM zinc finger [Ornithinimicrobium cerasi]